MFRTKRAFSKLERLTKEIYAKAELGKLTASEMRSLYYYAKKFSSEDILILSWDIDLSCYSATTLISSIRDINIKNKKEQK